MPARLFRQTEPPLPTITIVEKLAKALKVKASVLIE